VGGVTERSISRALREPDDQVPPTVIAVPTRDVEHLSALKVRTAPARTIDHRGAEAAGWRTPPGGRGRCGGDDCGGQEQSGAANGHLSFRLIPHGAADLTGRTTAGGRPKRPPHILQS